MFFGVFMLGMLILFVYLWGDYMKILIYLEILSLLFIMVVMWSLKLDLLSMNFFFFSLIFLVCESSMGFLLFIFFISMENEMVKKLSLIQF